MGATTSKPQVDALVDILADAVVSAEGGCIAAAENRVLLDVADVGGSVTIANARIRQLAEASVQCVHTADVEVGATYDRVRERLERITSSSAVGRGARATLVDRVSTAVSRRVVSQCLAASINAYEDEVRRVAGDVRILDLDLEQMARAQVTRCLLSDSVRVGDVPLRRYLEEELAREPLDPAALQGYARACPEGVQAHREAAFGVIGATAAVVMGVWGGYGIWRAKRRAS